MREKKSIIAIVGPTASGKSELAVQLAKKFNGEIISADSRQVYRGLNIGSGKVKGRWQKKLNKSYEVQPHKTLIYKTIPHHCIDYVSPKKRYTVVDFQQCAQKAIEDIRARGKIPFLVGGTGFYIDAVLGDTLFPSAPANPALRKKLERLPAEKLFAMLKKKDARRAATIDPHNKRRLIRALEIIETTGAPVPNQVFSNASHTSRQSLWRHDAQNLVWDRITRNDDVIMIGIRKTKEKLRQAITKRIRAMLKSGLVAETKKLHAAPPVGEGLSWKRIGEFGFEYRLPTLYLQKKITRKELEEQLKKENWRYAKRQITWWKYHQDICWISTFQEARRLLFSFCASAF